MRFKVSKTFSIQVNARKTRVYEPRIYDVPQEMPQYHAERCRQASCGAYVVDEKKAPENKVVEVAESKPTVARKTKRRGRPRSKPDG